MRVKTEENNPCLVQNILLFYFVHFLLFLSSFIEKIFFVYRFICWRKSGYNEGCCRWIHSLRFKLRTLSKWVSCQQQHKYQSLHIWRKWDHHHHQNALHWFPSSRSHLRCSIREQKKIKITKMLNLLNFCTIFIIQSDVILFKWTNEVTCLMYYLFYLLGITAICINFWYKD